MSTSDHEINRKVRAVLSRHWIDPSSTSFASRKGVVRLMGELRRVGSAFGASLEATTLTVLDTELRKLPGVRLVHFDLVNWRRDEEGVWVQLEQAPEPTLPVPGSAGSPTTTAGGSG